MTRASSAATIETIGALPAGTTAGRAQALGARDGYPLASGGARILVAGVLIGALSWRSIFFLGLPLVPPRWRSRSGLLRRVGIRR
jgi:hypothetical protein